MAIAAIHTGVGLSLTDFRVQLFDFFRGGAFNAVPHTLVPPTMVSPARDAVFWFFFTGFALFVLGQLVDAWERKGVALPRLLGWELIALSVTGAVLMPISGFGVFLLPYSIFHVWHVRRPA
jgi:hypothetical protein